ncbi:Thiazole synthase [compost metagenome]
MNPYNLEVIIEQAVVPVIVDAGLRSPSDAARAMEMGADAVLLNTAVSGSRYPVDMAKAMRLGVEAGRLAYEAGMIPVKRYAAASSPAEGMIHT